MSDWGDEDGIDAEPYDPDLYEREPGRMFGVDIAELAESIAAPAIATAVRKGVQDAVKQAVEEAVAEEMDPSVLEELHGQAATAARRAVRAAFDQLDSDEEDADEAPTLYYGSVDEFVRGFLLPNYRRRVGGTGATWAPDWWRYAEAVSRLEALWRAWEHLRLDPQTGMSVWFRDHADHHMAVLLSENGPFADVDTDAHKNKAGEPLPYEPPPEGLFPDVRETDGARS